MKGNISRSFLITLNIILLVCLGVTIAFFGNRKLNTTGADSWDHSLSQKLTLLRSRIETQSVQAAPTPSFNWSELQPDNYRTYLSNLRSVGCPEITIHDILVSQISRDYDSKIKKIREMHAAADSASGEIAESIRSLSDEKVHLIESLFPE